MFPSSVFAIFQLRNLATGRCLVAQGRASQKGGAVVLRPCEPRDPEQVNQSHDLTHQFLSYERCEHVTEPAARGLSESRNQHHY